MILFFAFLFFVLALIAGLLGFTDVMVASVGIAQVLFLIFFILFVFSLVLFILRKMGEAVSQTLMGGTNMLAWILTFFIIALVAGLLGFTGIMSAAAGVAKFLFIIFLVLFVVSILIHLFQRSK
ncbi:MAG: hypothetical protein ACD_16C00243G0004 [uncultured bacterium]|nr:MAG: hypothetical protein ACD_16C00243G0004 [uncultured bacterium]